MATLSPAELDTPEPLLPLLTAGQSGDNDRQYDIEVLGDMGGPVFDPLAAADVAAGLTVDALSNPDRLARLIDQHRRDPGQPGAGEVLDKLIATTFTPGQGRLAEVARRIQARTVLDLAAVARDPKTPPAVAAEIGQRLADLAVKLKAQPGADPSERAHRTRLAALLTDKDALAKVLDDPKQKPDVPPGMPIGDDGDY